MKYTSWGLLQEAESAVHFRIQRDQQNLVIGNLRSYGDVCLNDGAPIILSQAFNNLLAFDEANSLLVAESGTQLADLLEFLVPRGYFLPVTPGTRYVTLGGAIANDVHGKNHHQAGNIGNHIEWLDLERSDGSLLRCSPLANAEMFCATIGGLGLTGFIRRAALKVIKITSAMINAETIKFANLKEFFEINEESKGFPYTVAWVDCISSRGGKATGCGLYFRGAHTEGGDLSVHQKAKLTVPFNMPGVILNNLTMRLFNFAYYHQALKKQSQGRQHYSKFFYPLDGINHWNRGYGKSGFYQFQFVVPFDGGHLAFEKIFDVITTSGQGSFLAVLKTFGTMPPVGMLSFPREGITLALDFQNKGESTLRLLKRLEAMVVDAGGRIYPAKDAMMSTSSFLKGYPQFSDFLKYKDPNFSSNFFRRISAGKI
jgi:FAD/FMN-containing dehydrogenase